MALYIPKKIIVGFQKRSGTFTSKLGYLTFTDDKGVFRKEKSWNGWRDKSIEPLEIDNVPTPNFNLNKGVTRSRDWFGSGRSMIRVWDPRDFEFEITVDNLLNVLMHSDVSKRDINEECVYAWEGKNLVLLPVNSVEYQESLKFTKMLSNKVSTKDLVVGHTYLMKDNQRYVYLGFLPNYKVVENYNKGVVFDNRRKIINNVTVYSQPSVSKKHIFIHEVLKSFKYSASTVAQVVDEQVHQNFANLMSIYLSQEFSQKIKGITLIDRNVNMYPGYTATYFCLNVPNSNSIIKIGLGFTGYYCWENNKQIWKQKYSISSHGEAVFIDGKCLAIRNSGGHHIFNNTSSCENDIVVDSNNIFLTTPQRNLLLEKIETICNQTHDLSIPVSNDDLKTIIQKCFENISSVFDIGKSIGFEMTDGKIAKSHLI